MRFLELNIYTTLKMIFDELKLGESEDLDRAILWWYNLDIKTQKKKLKLKYNIDSIDNSLIDYSTYFRKRVLLEIYYSET